MEKYHTEVEKAHLQLEKEAVNELKKTYEQALKDIQERVKYLQSDEALESKIRQLNYQRALETQITGVLDVLKTDNIITINKYLNEAYNNGFVGSLYCMQKENIPLAFGIDEKRVLTSISKKIENMTFADREETNMDESFPKKRRYLMLNIKFLPKRRFIETFQTSALTFCFHTSFHTAKTCSGWFCFLHSVAYGPPKLVIFELSTVHLVQEFIFGT